MIALWDHAHGWRVGSADWFVWPAVSTLATSLGLTEDAVRRCLRELAARGWIRPDVNEGRRGWWLHVEPPPASPQLELFAAMPDEPSAVDNLGTATDNHRAKRDGCPDNHRVPSVIGTEGTVRTARDDDDAARVWSCYEADRVRMLGGEPRGEAVPLALRALIAEIGLPRVEAYARRALELAAEAVARDRLCAATLVLARADGREWHRARVEAVERYPDPQRSTAPIPRPPPPPDPKVDDERVTLHEREAYARGGADAVREQRAELAERPAAGVAHIADWLARHRAGGTACDG